MLDWLFETRTSILIILGLAVTIAVVIWWKSKSRAALIGLGIVCGFVLLYVALGALVTTDREKIENNLEAMVERFNAKDLDGTFEHFSNDFRYGTVTKQEMRQRADGVIRRYNVHNVRIWDVVVKKESPEKALVKFRVKADLSQGNPYPHFDCEATFHKEGDEKWRMTTFTLFKPMVREPFPIPGL